jgi:hypothetical protein
MIEMRLKAVCEMLLANQKLRNPGDVFDRLLQMMVVKCSTKYELINNT